MKQARWIFAAAGIYGLLLMLPHYFLEERIGRDYPPAVTHPEFFYGFIGVVIAWQVAFLIIARDPLRFRPLMPAAMLEKATFATATLVLYTHDRISAVVAGFGGVDFLWGLGFVWAFVRCGNERGGK